MGKYAVVVIDMLNDFVTGKLKCDRAQRIIPNIKRLSEAARKTGNLVVYVGDAHLPNDVEFKVWGPHALRGTKEAETIPELKPQKGDVVLEKRQYSAFGGTDLNHILRNAGVENVIITGLHTNICDRHTAASAFFNGYNVVVPDDCTEAFTDKDHLEGLEYLKLCYKAEVLSTNELIKKL
jgi:nicotinamidase-related amidase